MSNLVTQEPYLRHRLPNGLLVLLKEIHSAPLISHWIWYRVGSRDEKPGCRGISHWVEHMQFKGTPQFPAGVPDKLIAREGGIWNAFTSLDWTTYYETLPAEKIDLALSLEADRMVNSNFDPEEVASERTVIISERQGNENEPLFRLSEKVQEAAFSSHPYRHQVIGLLEDLKTIQRQDLYQHYRSYYIPNNAVLTLAGDFDTQAMLDRLEQLYAPIPTGAEPPRLSSPEPSQGSEQEVQVSGPGETCYMQIAFHVPAAYHPDMFPLMVLDSLLTGPSNLNMFSGGLSNKTSRLYQALVEGDLATSVYGGLLATIDPFLFSIIITLRPGVQPEKIAQVFNDEIQRLQDNPPPADEILQAIKQARALFAYGSESISNQAFWLGYSEMFADYTWFTSYLEQVERVSPEDVQRVAQDYLRPENRVRGIYLPEGNGGHLE